MWYKSVLKKKIHGGLPHFGTYQMYCWTNFPNLPWVEFQYIYRTPGGQERCKGIGIY